ncbi:MAG: nucleotidyltransferase family protein [Chlorobium sp.]|nr:nucleotidyltransferase family protein [Chlorobium sp.]
MISGYPNELLNLAKTFRRRTVFAPDVVAISDGIACGDKLVIELAESNGKIVFDLQVEGCLVCRASATYLSERLYGIPAEESESIAHSFLNGLSAPSRNDVILGPWQEWPITSQRQECIAAPWKLLISSLESLRIVCPAAPSAYPLACDACVQSHRVEWNAPRLISNLRKKPGLYMLLGNIWKVLRQRPSSSELFWQKLGKCVLSPEDVTQLADGVRFMDSQTVKMVTKLRLPALLYNNMLVYGQSPEKNELWSVVKRQRIRHAIIKSEIEDILSLIQSNGWKIVPVKGHRTAELYQHPSIRPSLDCDLVAGSFEDMVSLAGELIRNRGYRFVTGGSVPFSMKVVVDRLGCEVLIGHLHLEKVIDDAWQSIIDINFPSFPLGRVDQFRLSDYDSQPLWEEQLIITVCHLFKHEVAYIKDANDLYKMAVSGLLDWDRVALLAKENGLGFLLGLAFTYLRAEYDYTLSRPILRLVVVYSPFIRCLMLAGWPYSRSSHFMAKAVDLVARTFTRFGLRQSLNELSRQLSPESSGSSEGKLSQVFAVNNNQRFYLHPVILFASEIQIPSFEPKEELTFTVQIVTKCSLVLISNGSTRLLLTRMGIFFPKVWGDEDCSDRSSLTALTRSLIDHLGIQEEDLLFGATRNARPELWLF